jgi:hypothetical protein
MRRTFRKALSLARAAALHPLVAFRVLSSKFKYLGAYFSLAMVLVSLGAIAAIHPSSRLLDFQNSLFGTYVATSLAILWLSLVLLWHSSSSSTRINRTTPGGPPNAQNAGGQLSQTLSFLKANRLRKLTPDPVRVGIVSDEFTALSIEHWARLTHLTPANFTEVLEQEDLQMVLIESAWKGHEGSWLGKLRNGPSQEIRELIFSAKSLGLPIVFWNKEDPVHFDEFVELATLADLVLTTDVNCVERYKVAGISKVEIMQFGINPLIHNTFGAIYSRASATYAGSFYSKYKARSAKVIEFLSPIPKHRLVIRDRNFGNPYYRFPAGLSASVQGSLPYLTLLSEQKLHRAALNFDSVTDSPTMFSRRVVELMASGVPVVSTQSQGLKGFVDKGLVLECNAPEEMSAEVAHLVSSSHLAKTLGKTASRFAFENLDTRNGFHNILNQIGVELPLRHLPSVDIICSTNRPDQLEHLLRQISRQKYSQLANIHIGIHGFKSDMSQLFDLASKEGLAKKVSFSFHPVERSLGAVLDALSKETEASFVAKFDDDDYYLPNYLIDQVDAAIFTDAEVVGKWTRVVHLQEGDWFGLQFPDNENQFTKLVGGSTILAKRDALSLGFADLKVGEDTDFLNRVRYEGGAIYSTDYMNYFFSRRQSGHAWQLTQSEIRGNTTFVGYGTPERYVEC